MLQGLEDKVATPNVNSATSQVDDKAAHTDESTHEQQQVVKFVDEGVHEQAAIAKITPVDPCAVQTAKERKTHTIRDFMNRPNKLFQFTWSSSDDAGKMIAKVVTPNDLFKRPMIREKIEGFTFFRGTTAFKIQINATPFQQGRLLAVFVPYGSKATRTQTALTHLGGLTGFPHVDMDISTVQTMTLRVPFVSPLTHINLVKGYGTIGELRLYVYGPLAASESTKCSGTIWGWFEDIETEIPTGAKISQVLLQSAEGATNDVADLAQSAAPLLNTVGMLSAAALEKPLSLKHSMPMQPSLQRTFANGLGVDTSKTFTINPVAQVQKFTGKFGSTQNEMELSYITKTPSFLDVFPWRTNDTINKVIWKMPVHPATLPANLSNKNLSIAKPTTLAYISTLFKYWQGDLVYTFKFVKTGYHSGRLRLVFIPGAEGSVQYDPDKCYTTILDLREKNEFEIAIPYVNSSPWDLVSARDTEKIQPFAGNGIGLLAMEVLNELVAPGITANAIVCLVEIRGGDNFQLAFPMAPGWIPISSDPSASRRAAVQLQAFDEAPTRDAAQTGNDLTQELFESSLKIGDVCSEKYCIGEKIKSVKSLLMRFNYLDTYNSKSRYFIPWFANSSTDQNISDTNSRRWGDYYSYLSAIYAFQCGGMRIKLVNAKNPNDRVMATLMANVQVPSKIDEATKDLVINSDARFCPFPRTIAYPNHEGAIEVEIPFYSQTYATVTTTNHPMFPVPEDPTNWKGQGVHFEFLGDGGDYIAFRAVADDFEFGYLIGAPTLARVYHDVE